MDLLLENELDEDLEEDLLQILGIYYLHKRATTRRRRYWVHLINQERAMYGEYHTLYKNLLRDSERFHIYFRMNESEFKLNTMRSFQ